MSDIKFSVITVSLNSENDIEKTIISVASQNYPNKEHIVIDGGSVDATVDIIRKYDDKISFWVSEPDSGIADAMNKGISYATGDYLLFINSDDYLINENVLKNIFESVQERLDYYIFKVHSVYPDNKTRLLPNNDFSFATNFKMRSCHQGHVISRKLFKHYGGYDCSFRIGMDYEFVLRVLRQGIKSRSVDLVISGMGQAGISSRKDWAGLEQRFMDERKAQTKNCPNIVFAALYLIYWHLYIAYRKISHVFQKDHI
ncbi:MAG: glycosyltransferase family 2 protein [Proteobacteria bacterium]|nr:glycosyltransferase family 2 protein [Pseudomonadota bacterium]